MFPFSQYLQIPKPLTFRIPFFQRNPISPSIKKENMLNYSQSQNLNKVEDEKNP